VYMFVVSTSAVKWEDEKTQLEVRAAAAGGPNPCFFWGGGALRDGEKRATRRRPGDAAREGLPTTTGRATRREKDCIASHREETMGRSARARRSRAVATTVMRHVIYLR
jgi:hypothetical protein